MLIGIDVSPAAKKNKTGVEWYCYHVANELTKIDQENSYRFYTKEPFAQEFASFPDNFKEVVLPGRRFWTHTALAVELMRNPVDVFFSPGHIVPWWHPRRTVSTLHDAGFRHYKDNYSRYQYLHAQVNVYASARWSNPIIVPSDFVSRDVQAFYGLPPEAVLTVPNGFDPSEFENVTAEETAAARAGAGITLPYFIFIGRLEPRKNIKRALEAFFSFIDETGIEMQFVLAGSPAIGADEMTDFINSHKRADLILRPGYVPSRHKAALLGGAEALVFPTLYEGFGIPILEAFAAGTPVITSNVTSCPEIAGDAAVIVDPFDVGAIRKAMQTVTADKALAAGLVEKGKARARQYNWSATARAIHEILTQPTA
jgi:glycosyltransferase involved in cell wall biosynthesis